MITITNQRIIKPTKTRRAIPPMIKPASAIGLPPYCCGFRLICVSATAPSTTASKPNIGPPQIHPNVILMRPKINEPTAVPCCCDCLAAFTYGTGGRRRCPGRRRIVCPCRMVLEASARWGLAAHIQSVRGGITIVTGGSLRSSVSCNSIPDVTSSRTSTVPSVVQ